MGLDPFHQAFGGGGVIPYSVPLKLYSVRRTRAYVEWSN